VEEYYFAEVARGIGVAFLSERSRVKYIVMRLKMVFLLVFCLVVFVACTKKQEVLGPSGSPMALETLPPIERLLRSTPFTLSIGWLREQEFEGSDLVMEETLAAGSNYDRYVASYMSDGNKIYGLLTVPRGTRPERGWPVVIFNHGYIPPREYRTTERYVGYVDAFARNGYIVFKSDYRGHGNSEGEATGGYGSNGYTIDVLNALASVRRFPEVDQNRIGMWGHSMGGFITLRAMVVDKDIKAGVIWGGVVASYPDIIFNWRRRSSPRPGWRDTLMEEHGTPSANPKFWDGLSANSYLEDISGPVQLHHAEGDEEVPVEFSQKLAQQLQAAGKEAELFVYTGDNHNISGNFNIAMQRSVEFMDRYVKME
jgi:uncharacterized protein